MQVCVSMLRVCACEYTSGILVYFGVDMLHVFIYVMYMSKLHAYSDTCCKYTLCVLVYIH